MEVCSTLQTPDVSLATLLQVWNKRRGLLVTKNGDQNSGQELVPPTRLLGSGEASHVFLERKSLQYSLSLF